jgi:hypothetical protein
MELALIPWIGVVSHLGEKTPEAIYSKSLTLPPLFCT